MIRQIYFVLFVVVCYWGALHSQNSTVKGRVIDSHSTEAIAEVEVKLFSTLLLANTNSEGKFIFPSDLLPIGEQILELSKEGYTSLRIPITIKNGRTINLDPILLEIDLSKLEAQLGIISLSDELLEDEEGVYHNISGLLQASNDIFLNAVAYDFSATYFRPRGMDNTHGKVLINGIEMNKLFDKKPQWGTWGGLNDVQRNRIFTPGIKANDIHFGDLSGTTNFVKRASMYKKGRKLSYAYANRSYQGRIMASYFSGNTKEGWSHSASISRRFGKKGFKEGTFYNANSFFASIEKRINHKHSINLTAFYTPIRRGSSSAITKEVYKLKGRAYNPNWGFQNGDIRNSKIREIKEPVIILNHYLNISEKVSINTNIAFQTGSIGTTRLDYGNNRNPFGNYYQRMPSYFLRNENLSPYNFYQAYLAEQELLGNGQINWNMLYNGNRNSSNKLSSYVIQEDITKDFQLSGNSILRSYISENITLNATINFKKLKSEKYARIKDLLGGHGYLDVDYFSINDFGISGDETQSDLQNPDRIVSEGDRYKYNYRLDANVISGFAQTQFSYKKIDFYLGIMIANTQYQRTGIFENGHFPDSRSLGSSEQIGFTTFGIKGGANYKITGRHLFDINGVYLTRAPSLKNTFPNARQNNDLVKDISIETLQTIDISYIYRSPLIKARLTGYYSEILNETDIGFYFTQNALGNEDNSAFVQETVTGISKRNVGAEFGIEAQLLPTFKLKAAAAYGQHLYSKNPILYLSGDDFLNGNDIEERGLREVNFKNFHVPAGPEIAYQVGFEYRSPEFWWVGVTTNYFSNAYIDISYLRRTSDFYTDTDGLPFNDYQEDVAKKLLKQESLGDYFLVNVVGGKSWKVKNHIIGFFASINNILDQKYITGGYENSRRSSYRQQLEESEREHGPLFGNNYFFGNGTTFYLNTYIRF